VVVYEQYFLLGGNAVQSTESQLMFWRNILPPSSGLPPAFTLVSCSAYFFTLKMRAICSSEKLVDFQQTTQHYIPKDSTLQNHGRLWICWMA
jgi:hypothetical protein